MKEPPIVAVYRDLTDIERLCEDCKYGEKVWYEDPCESCRPRHCGYEPKEGWDK